MKKRKGNLSFTVWLTALVLMVAVTLTTPLALTLAVAKYSASATGTAQVRVAKWDPEVVLRVYKGGDPEPLGQLNGNTTILLIDDGVEPAVNMWCNNENSEVSAQFMLRSTSASGVLRDAASDWSAVKTYMFGFNPVKFNDSASANAFWLSVSRTAGTSQAVTFEWEAQQVD